VSGIFPILVMIHASKALSLSAWGEILLFQSLSLFSCIIIFFGTDVYGLREISKFSSNSKKITEIINQVYHIRIINFLFYLLITSLLSLLNNVSLNSILITASWTLALVISPLWIYIGLGKLKLFFFTELLTKTIIIITIYLNVLSDIQSNFLIFLLIITNYFINSLTLFFLKKNISFSVFGLNEIKRIYKKTTPFFLIQFCANVFTTFPILIVGLTSGAAQAAIFGNAERLFRIFRSLYSPLNRIVLQHSVSRKIDKNEKKKEFILAAIIGVVVFLVGSLFVFFFIEIFLGPNYKDSINVSLILLASIPFVFTANQILHSYIYPSNNELFFMKTLLWLTPFNIISLFSLSYFMGSHGTAISMIMAESALFIVFFSFIKIKFRNT
tara:strand:- start:2084 stop:3238 length:1155 start_codon:yes stop_codon:yes gene_type:complete